MKSLLFLVLPLVILSCSSSRNSFNKRSEDQLITTRKYIGNYIGFYHTEPQVVGGIDLIWIKTTVYPVFGKISAYGRTCEFAVGDKIYLKPLYSDSGNYGNWVYQIENDNAISYRVSEYRYENNIFVKRGSL
jgi:hypothetical protein